MRYKAVAGTDSAIATFTVQILNDGQITLLKKTKNLMHVNNRLVATEVEKPSIEIPIAAGFTVLQDNQLTIRVSADMSGCESSGGGTSPPDDPPGGETEARQFGGSECSATLYFGAIDGGADQFTMIEVKSNALSNSILLVQKDGADVIDGIQIDWYPNDIISERTMQFRFEEEECFWALRY